MRHKHLFIITMPFSGSTLLASLLGTSPKLSLFNTDQHEGTKLPGMFDLLNSDYPVPYNPAPWAYLRRLYMQHWDLSKPVLVEKGHYPRDAQRIAEHFPNTHFIIMVRNPYAWCESMKRRAKNPPGFSELALIWVRQCSWHIHNIHTLKKVLGFTYEDLCDRTDETLKRLGRFMPELRGLDPDREFAVHSTLGKKSNRITNTNAMSIARLTSGDVAEINSKLKAYPDLLEYFGYSLIEPLKV
jgi:hypothetical protein